jgi:hypothetical protein
MKTPGRSLLIITIVLIAVVGGSALILTKKGVGNENENGGLSNPVIDELISSSSDGLPEYALSSKKTEAGYRVAIKIPDILEKMPCYCSCGAIGHGSLKNCYIKAEGGFEEHASYCDICVNEALDVYMWQKEGVSLKEIRSRIDEKYSRYGEPTDTPLI